LRETNPTTEADIFSVTKNINGIVSAYKKNSKFINNVTRILKNSKKGEFDS